MTLSRGERTIDYVDTMPGWASLAYRYGNGHGLQIADVKAGLQVMKVAIAHSGDLSAWTEQELGWSKDDMLAWLKEQFGELEPGALDLHQAGVGSQPEWA